MKLISVLLFQFFLLASAWAGTERLPLISEAPVIYGVSPFYFSPNQGKDVLSHLRQRLPEIRSLGANILWIQPLFPSAAPGQGYDTIDAFRVHPHFGTEADLRALVREAHRLGMRVILDVALNHLPVEHPFAKDVIQKGERSKSWDFFQREIDPSHAYSKHAHQVKKGKATFVHYFWKSFMNLNYDHPATREYALSVLEHWVKHFGIDGYRLDASWGPQNRWSGFYQAVSERLQRIRPDIFILAEDHAAVPEIYRDSKQPHLRGARIASAYDWDFRDPDFVSKWSFQTGDDHHHSVFNHPDPDEAARIFVRQVRALDQASQALPLRFLQNNDSPSFLGSHSREQTKAAAAALFLLPGVPLIYYGQEMGFQYDIWHLPTVDPERPMASFDAELWDFYKDLLELKQSRPALREGRLTSIRTRPGGEVEFTLEHGKDREIVRFGFKSKQVRINGVPLERLFLSPRRCGAVFRSSAL